MGRVTFMSQAQIEQLADEAINEACRYIQDKLRVETGDFAGIYFSGDRGRELEGMFKDYIRSEIEGGFK